MQLTIAKRDLAAILKYTCKAVENRNTIPILSNVLLSAQNNALTVKATDLDIAVEALINCEVGRKGATTVPAKLFESIVNKFKPDATIILQQDGDEAVLNVKSGRSRFKLQTLPVVDFPDLAINDVTSNFELPVADLLKMLDRAEFCVSDEETRYYLNGIYLHHYQNSDDKSVTLRAVATDGHRLAQIECAAPNGADHFKSANNPCGVIIPRKTVRLISGILRDGGLDKIGVQLNDVRALFTLGNVTIASKLIDGSFPDYERVVPKGNDKIVRCNRLDLLAAVDRVAAISSEHGRAAKFELTAGKMLLSIKNSESGSANEELDVDYDGDPLDIGFNSKYMMDILGKVDGDQAEMRFADNGSPAIIAGVDNHDTIFVAMPMRV